LKDKTGDYGSEKNDDLICCYIPMMNTNRYKYLFSFYDVIIPRPLRLFFLILISISPLVIIRVMSEFILFLFISQHEFIKNREMIKALECQRQRDDAG
jgi:hypothetical protein